MSNDAKMAKYELVLEEIKECLDVYNSNRRKYSAWDDLTWTGLALIYDYNKLNEYGKRIIDLPDLPGHCGGADYYEERESLLDDYDDEAFKVRKAKEFVDKFQHRAFSLLGKDLGPGYTFMFWALMILSVDDTDREERLSSICDLAKIWQISDEEMMDIVHVIRIVYYREEAKFQNMSVMQRFAKLLKNYGYGGDDKKVIVGDSPVNTIIFDRNLF